MPHDLAEAFAAQLLHACGASPRGPFLLWPWLLLLHLPPRLRPSLQPRAGFVLAPLFPAVPLLVQPSRRRRRRPQLQPQPVLVHEGRVAVRPRQHGRKWTEEWCACIDMRFASLKVSARRLRLSGNDKSFLCLSHYNGRVQTSMYTNEPPYHHEQLHWSDSHASFGRLLRSGKPGAPRLEPRSGDRRPGLGLPSVSRFNNARVRCCRGLAGIPPRSAHKSPGALSGLGQSGRGRLHVRWRLRHGLRCHPFK